MTVAVVMGSSYRQGLRRQVLERNAAVPHQLGRNDHDAAPTQP